MLCTDEYLIERAVLIIIIIIIKVDGYIYFNMIMFY